MFHVVIGSPAEQFLSFLFSLIPIMMIIATVIYVTKTVNRLTGLLDRLARSNERIVELLDDEKK